MLKSQGRDEFHAVEGAWVGFGLLCFPGGRASSVGGSVHMLSAGSNWCFCHQRKSQEITFGVRGDLSQK